MFHHPPQYVQLPVNQFVSHSSPLLTFPRHIQPKIIQKTTQLNKKFNEDKFWVTSETGNPVDKVLDIFLGKYIFLGFFCN